MAHFHTPHSASYYSGLFEIEQGNSEPVDGHSVASNRNHQVGHALSPPFTGAGPSFLPQANSFTRQLPNPQDQDYTQVALYQPKAEQHTQNVPVSSFRHRYQNEPSVYRQHDVLPAPPNPQDDIWACTTITHSRATEILCFFGGPCPHLTASMLTRKASAIHKHLEDCHSAQLRSQGPVGAPFSRCLWEDPTGRPCFKDVHGVSQLAKHIATVHLKLLEVMCNGCGGTFSRKDSLNRHRAGGRCVPGASESIQF